jgi:segregation and condensation protein B
MEEIWQLKPKIEALLIASNRPVSISALAQCLGVEKEDVDAALQEFEADLLSADRGIRLHRRAETVRIEIKPQYTDLLGLLLPERKAKPISAQALETLAIVALKQPITTGDINSIRDTESAGTIQTLRSRKLIARAARLGPRRERFWHTTPIFLETFGLASLDELYKDGRMDEVFPSVYSAEVDTEDGEELEKHR